MAYPNAKFGKYVLEKLIGSGGYSDVWLARKIDDGKRYAIKIPRFDTSVTISASKLKEVAEELFKEAEIWARLKHKNIVKLYDYGYSPLPHIVIEYCPKTLRSMIGKLSVEDAINIARKVAEALEYAHYHGVIHRDIKPENVLICNGEPKLSDWGIAKVLLETATRSGYSGTLAYSAPEQLNPDEFGEVDWRTDIWQFGCLLYELIEGKLPFNAEYLGQLTIQILSRKPEPMRKAPKWVEQIINKCLEKNKNNRWRSISMLIEKLAIGKPQIVSVEEPELQKIKKPFTLTNANRSAAEHVTSDVNLLMTLEGHSSSINAVVWSPDGKHIASSSDDKTVRVWDAATGMLLRTLEGHSSSVESVAWSPDGKYIASGSDDKTVMVWDAATGKLLRTLEGHTYSGLSVAWSPDGT